MNKRKLRLRLVLAPFALAFFAFTQQAQAASYTCSNVPASVTGDADITESGSCNIGYPVTATGRIKITAGGAVTTQSLTATQEVDIQAPASSDITVTGSLNSDLGFVNLYGANISVSGTVAVTNNGNILIRAQKNLVTGSVTGAPGFNIDLKANQDGSANTVFTIGGTGNANGVNGTITARPVGYAPYFAGAIIHVVNGTGSSTGGITLTNPANIVATPQPGTRAAYIFLNAQNGVLTIPTGTLSADGTGSNGAGLIALMARTIAFGANAIVSASQSSSAVGTLHGVLISAEKVTYQGTSGLNLIGSGNGADTFNTGYVQVFPQGVVTISDPETPANLPIFAVIGTIQAGNVTFQGTGTAPLNITADGNDTRIAFTGTTLTFTGGAVKMQARGATNHKIRLQNPGTLTGANVGLNFGGTGAVTLDVLGVAGAGGDIELFLDKATFNKPTYTFTANGPTASNGDGGTINVSSQLLTLSPTARLTITANASSSGTGNAIASDPQNGDPKAIKFFPGGVPLDIGTASGVGQVSFAAKGGQTGGNGGTIVISSSPVNIKTANAVNASALAGNGNGGEIFIFSNIQSLEPSATMTAIGKGTGKGGKFTTGNSAALAGDINRYVKVDGGTNVGSQFHGSIKLNGITCQQRKTTSTSAWPKTYWNCVNTEPNPESDLDKVIGQVTIAKLSSTLRNLGSSRIFLYEFSSFAAFQSYFSQSPQDTVAGATWMSVVGTTPNIYSSVTAPSGRTEATLREITIHELGHAFDLLKGRANQSANSSYNNYVQNDFLTLDYLTEQSGPPFVQRNPCIQNGSLAAPFSTISSVCGVDGLTLNPTYAGLKNSEILRHPNLAATYWFNKNVTLDAWNELYAQALSYQAYIATTTPTPVFAYIVPDTIFSRGYFSCSRSWAQALAAGQTTPPGTGTCANVLPTGYGPY